MTGRKFGYADEGSDWDKLNNEVTALTGNSQVHNKHILSLFEKVANLADSQQKLMDTLETQLGAIRDLHDTVKTHTGMIERTNETVSGHGGVLDKLLETVASQSRSIERLHNNTADLQKRVKSLEAKDANMIHIKDTGAESNISTAGFVPKGSGNISVNIPQTTQPTKDNTGKLLLKRFLAVQRICEASIELDTHRAVAPSSDRQWLAQSVLNILNGNVDE